MSDYLTEDCTSDTEDSASDKSDKSDKTNNLTPSMFVGVGASAGGLEALQNLFSQIPADTGAAFIVVQHLSPDFKSMMDELLSRHTKMPVHNVKDGTEVHANNVYLTPARKNVLLAEGKLFVSEQMPDQGIHLPIDIFLRSLAKEQLHRSAAIILSGTGSDGSRGIKAIKEAGGLVLVQDPNSAKFDGMPYNAKQTGHADFVLKPQDIADKLTKLISLPISIVESETVLEVGQHTNLADELFNLLRAHTNIDFANYKYSTVSRRLERRMNVTHMLKLSDYLNHLRHNPTEVEALTRELLISVTSFFRDGTTFQYLEQNVLDDLIADSSDGELRIWIAGCATGEEAYSIAALIDEAIERSDKNLNFKLFATDVDASALHLASTGRFTSEIEADVTAPRLARYFQPVENGYVISPSLRSKVVFASHNMINDPPFSNIDLCVCRNVLIYFQPEIQKKVLSSFHFSLRKNGVLFLGSAESIGDLDSHFDSISERHKLYRKINDARIPMPAVLSQSSQSLSSPRERARKPAIDAALLQSRSNYDHVKEALLIGHVGACAILDRQYNIIHIYGEFSKYTKPFSPGKLSTNVKDLIVDELVVALSTSLSRSKNEEQTVSYHNIRLLKDETTELVNLHTRYFNQKGTGSQCYSVLIEPVAVPGDMTVVAGINFNDDEQSLIRIRDLENELLNKQESLQVANEELETSNEELQSANEELMSANEELQSTNEELQSVNEELFTVNSEYQEKISELSMAHDDLDNILQSTAIGIIFLDQNIQIRKYTQVATRFFNILPTDVGRPLHHISHELNDTGIFEDIVSVNSSHKSKSREVFTYEGVPVQLKIVPYRSSIVDEDDGMDGCIVTLTDISSDLYQPFHLEQKPVFEESQPSIDRLALSELKNKHITLLQINGSESDRLVTRLNLDQIDNLHLNVLESTSTAEGLKISQQHSVDVYLLDNRLGIDVMTEFIQKIKARHSHAVFLLLSQTNYNESYCHVQEGMFDGHMNKQEMSPRSLEILIRRAICSSASKSTN